jgi:hypothetical protein
MAETGMPRFSELDDAELQNLFFYIREGAREALLNPQAVRPQTQGSRL